MGKYAEETKVPVERSVAEIGKTLKRYGASWFLHGYDEDRGQVSFKMANRIVMIKFVLPESPQKLRQRYRALLLAVKSKLECVESGIETFEEAFLAHLVLPGGKTVGERFVKEYLELMDSGRPLPRLLPGQEGV